MLNMVKGCKVHDPSLLHEGYQRTETGFIANLSAENIRPVVEHFLSLQDEWVFLILEVPTNAREETQIEPGVFETLHMDVYYLDGLKKDNAIGFLQNFAELLIHDGMSRFGFGSHSGNNEIMVKEYNVATIYTANPERYNGMFESHGIPEAQDLKTAWNYFTADTPGECEKIKCRGKDIYEIVEYLKPYGLYFSERREKF